MRRAWIGLALVLFSVPVSAQPRRAPERRGCVDSGVPPGGRSLGVGDGPPALDRSGLRHRRSRRGADVLRLHRPGGRHSSGGQGTRSRAARRDAARRWLSADRRGLHRNRATRPYRDLEPRHPQAPRWTGEPQPWRVAAADLLSSVDGLHRLVAAPRQAVRRAEPRAAIRRLRGAAALRARSSSPRRPTGSPPSCSSATAASSSRRSRRRSAARSASSPAPRRSTRRSPWRSCASARSSSSAIVGDTMLTRAGRPSTRARSGVRSRCSTRRSGTRSAWT